MGLSKEEKDRIYKDQYNETRKSGETSKSFLESLGDMAIPFKGSEEYEIREQAKEDARNDNSDDD